MTDTFDGVEEYRRLFREGHDKTEDKRKMRELMAKYGETELDIENHATPVDYMNFLMAGGRDVLKMVQKENMMERITSPYPQTPMPTAARGNPEYTISNANSLFEKGILDDIDNPQVCERKVTANGVCKIERFDKDEFMGKMKPIIKKHEGIILHPYVDTADVSTVGPGINIDSNAEGVEWLQLNPKTNKLRPLNPDKPEDKAIIDAELARLEPYKNGNKRGADFFKDKTNLRISVENADQLYRSRVDGFIQDINGIIDDFNDHLGEEEGYIDSFERLPENLQIVLVDMVYNLGKTGFDWKQKTETRKDGSIKKYGYPNFWKALAHRDVNKMMEQCIRNKDDKGFVGRNKAIQELIRETPDDWTKKGLKK